MITDQPSKKINIYPLPLSADAKTVFSTAKSDIKLIEAINKERDRLIEEGVEIFEQKDNIIVTERGYFAAFYDKES